MKHLLPILLICSIGFTQELTVDGNLNVTGNIQNQTIDSLLQVIQSLESQLSALQVDNRLETRVFDIEVSNNVVIDFNEILGFEFEYFLLEILNGIPPSNSIPSQSVTLIIENSLFSHFGVVKGEYYPWNLNTFTWDTGAGPKRGLFLQNGEDIIFRTLNENGNSIWSLKIAITTQFPDSDVQLRKTGLQSKDKETVK